VLRNCRKNMQVRLLGTYMYTVPKSPHLYPTVENGRLSDRYRIGTDTGCIVSNRIGYCCIGRYTRINAGSSTVDGIALHTMIKGRSSARRARTRACCFMVHDVGEGWGEGREAEGDCNLIPASP